MRRLEHSLTRGNLWLYVLSTLSRKRVHAYGLGAELERRFGWSHGLVTTYVVLYKLESEGLIKSGFDGRRKYYSLTAKGRGALREAKSYLKRVSASL
jgi:DNA-binding PadR family transcriptional regulator